MKISKNSLLPLDNSSERIGLTATHLKAFPDFLLLYKGLLIVLSLAPHYLLLLGVSFSFDFCP